jgi:uncharacterized protein
MTASPTIKRMSPPTVGMDFWQLRREGIEYIIRLGSDFWTDYNLHDPGITMLEVLSYAITDLSYRANLPIGDLLATESGNVAPSGMPLAPELLTCNPVTFDDFRKLLIDIDGVKNAWVRKATLNSKDTEGWIKFFIETKDVKIDPVPSTEPKTVSKRFLKKPPVPDTAVPPISIPLNGLYEILIDLDDQTDCCTPDEALQNVRATLLRYRNLCEDYVHIGVVETVNVSICSLIDIEEDADVNDIAASLLFHLQEFLTPTLPFYSLAQMLERKKTTNFDELFEGVLLQNGFIDDNELAASDLKTSIHVSDFYNIMGAIEGVKSVKGVKLHKENDNDAAHKPIWEDWELFLFNASEATITRHKPHNHDFLNLIKTPVKPVLTLKDSNINFRKRGNTILINAAIVEEKLEKLRAMNTPLSMRGKNAIDYPNVTARPNLTDYFTIQNEFPHVYHVGKEGIESGETSMRKSQVKQLKGYLTFFDQILTNYLGYLANVKNLLSVEQPPNLPTRFSQPLYKVPFIEDLLLDYNATTKLSKPYDDFLATGLESKSEALHQKNSLLNHLIARFAETFSDFAMTRYYDDPRTPDADDYLLRLEQNLPEKVRFLHQIPEIQRERGKGFDYQKHIKNKPDVWETDNVEGLKKRVCALLGIADARRKTLTCPPSYKVVRFSASNTSKRGFSFVITDQNEKPLLEAFTPQPTEDRRRQQIKETMDALTSDTVFRLLTGIVVTDRAQLIKDFQVQLPMTKSADGKVIRFGNTENNNIILQKDGEAWRFLVLNPDEKVLAKSISFFEKVGDAFDFLTQLKAAVSNDTCDSEGFHIVEHILLRPRCEDCLGKEKPAIDLRKCLNANVPMIDGTPQYPNDVADPYSFWITVVASKNWKRFSNKMNQAYFEQTLRAETPAHIGLRMCWLTNDELFDFETAYGNWLIELAQYTPDRCEVDEMATNLVTVLNRLTCNCCDSVEESDELMCS